jgi:hypothetical protein
MTNPALDRTFALLSVILMEPPDDNFDETERNLAFSFDGILSHRLA